MTIVIWDQSANSVLKTTLVFNAISHMKNAGSEYVIIKVNALKIGKPAVATITMQVFTVICAKRISRVKSAKTVLVNE